MTQKNDFLLEILTEELPSKDLKNLSMSLGKLMQQELQKLHLSFQTIETFGAPRRLAVLIKELSSHQPDQKIERRGPPYNKAFDDAGNPTQTAIGFAKSCHTDVSQLEKLENDKGCWVVYKFNQPGQSALQLMPNIVSQAIHQLPIKKAMRWGEHTEEFVRPVHAITMLYGDKVIPLTLFDIPSSNTTNGHRFLSKKSLTIHQPKDYESILEQQGHVIPNFEKRKETIRSQLIKTAHQHHFLPIIDEQLLEEVTSLVEWPVTLMGKFDQAFLEVPAEALISSMQNHQRCFPLTDHEHRFTHHFLIVSNLQSLDSMEIIKGNERVMNARLADALFFYRTDQATPIENFVEKLKAVIFQTQLGTLYDKTQRLIKITEYLAEKTGSSKTTEQAVKRAALLAKADLMSAMVGEFPELQGIMGYYYALHHKECEKVAVAIREHYMPYNTDSELPQSLEGQLLALADRIDTLIGIFGINKKPTGDKDPFGLRRAALGVIRLLIAIPLPINLFDLLNLSKEHYGSCLSNTNTTDDVCNFIYERLKNWLVGEKYTAAQFASIEQDHLQNIPDFIARLEAIREFCQKDEATSLAAANKRVCQLLKKQETRPSDNINESLLKEEAEIALAKTIQQKEKEIAVLHDYALILKSLTDLHAPVNQFFDQVMIMVEEDAIRNNRLALLQRLRNLFLRVADISVL